ncbi:MAG: calcium/sodium antiporter [Phycisphaerales bacterium]|nr:calcium/sodium antiporter [Phycisphaerales bacterium]
MSMLLEILALIGGLAVLIAGADMLVRGAAQLARVFGLSPFAIGVTVVAFGTSAPELFASIGAALQDVEELAIGNVVGSNIANILLILGAGAMIAPIGIHRRVRLVELPIMLAITAGAAALLNDGILTRADGVFLVVGLIAYVIFIVRAHRVDIEHEGEEVVTHPKSAWLDVLMVIIGVVALGFGARALVYGATGVATRVGVSEGVVGTTIVALGTSLPELAATVRAAIGKSSDIAVGNVVGSNIFNLLSVLGITSIVHPLAMQAGLGVHIWIMLGVSLAMVFFALIKPAMGRLIGGAFLLLYAGYIAFAFVG